VAAAKLVPCPRCKTLAPFGAQNKWRPFCSERCKTIDLGDWASERYRVGTEEPAKNADEGGSEDPA
jgi:endogenous inhibitor of DNA gyrase (YacG/DUF329 family)